MSYGAYENGSSMSAALPTSGYVSSNGNQARYDHESSKSMNTSNGMYYQVNYTLPVPSQPSTTNSSLETPNHGSFYSWPAYEAMTMGNNYSPSSNLGWNYATSGCSYSSSTGDFQASTASATATTSPSVLNNPQHVSSYHHNHHHQHNQNHHLQPHQQHLSWSGYGQNTEFNSNNINNKLQQTAVATNQNYQVYQWAWLLFLKWIFNIFECERV